MLLILRATKNKVSMRNYFFMMAMLIFAAIGSVNASAMNDADVNFDLVANGDNNAVMQDHQHGRRGGGRGPNIEQMAEELQLTADQKEQLQKAFEEMRPKQGEARPSREEMEKRRAELDEKVKSILTEEQYNKYKELRANRNPQGRPNRQ